MKVFLLTVVFCFHYVFANLVSAQIIIGVSSDFSGSHEETYSTDRAYWEGSDGRKRDVSKGVSISGEAIKAIGMFQFGAGIDYQLPRAVKNMGYGDTKAKIHFLSYFASGKVSLTNTFFKPIIGARLGYNTFSVNGAYYGSLIDKHSKGGLYYGLTAAVQMQRLLLELTSCTNAGIFDIQGDKTKVEYSKISIGLRYILIQ